MSPAPTARVPPLPICARSWKPLACAFTSIPRPIWCGSTNVFVLAAAVAACWSATTNCAPCSKHCERANAGDPITIFEIETAAAFCLFAQHPADVVLLEVGLGGRLDATNVIDAPLATVIAPVSMDHTEFLGNSLTAIAGEKAAIIKRNAPVVCAEQAPEAMAVIEAQAQPHARAAACGRPAMACQRRARPAGLSGRSRPDGSGGAKTVRPASVRQCRACDRDLACARCVQDRHARISRPASSTPNGRRGCSGWFRARWSSRARRAARSGSMADTMPKAGASPRRRWAISRSGCRGRWWSSRA